MFAFGKGRASPMHIVAQRHGLFGVHRTCINYMISVAAMVVCPYAQRACREGEAREQYRGKKVCLYLFAVQGLGVW